MQVSISYSSVSGSVMTFDGSASDPLNGNPSSVTLTWQAFDWNKDLVASQSSQGSSGAFAFTAPAPGAYTVSLVASDSDAVSRSFTDGGVVSFSPTTFTPTLAVSSSANPAVYGQAVTLTAQLSANVFGDITFYNGATSLGVGTEQTDANGILATLSPQQPRP